MGKKKQKTFWACDFESTVWGKEIEKQKGKKQDRTEVWAAASTKLYDDTETVYLHHSIRDWINFIMQQPGNNVVYFHNLSFDGSFIIDFILRNGWKWVDKKPKDLYSREFTTSISDMGQWYKITLRLNHTTIEIRNSLKLMPKSLRAIGNSFGTKHQKLDIEYEGERYAYCPITPEEEQYIQNDVLVLKEALELMFAEGHDKLTIGSCCLSEYKSGFDRRTYERLFPRFEKHSGFIFGWNPF